MKIVDKYWLMKYHGIAASEDDGQIFANQVPRVSCV